MAEIFSRTASNFAGAFSADTLTLSFSDRVPTTLVQNLQASYMQSITRLYEVGAQNGISNTYYVGGRSQGSLNIGRIIGPGVLMGAYYTKFGNVCNARTNSLAFGLTQADCSAINANPGLTRFVCKFCVITNVGVSVGAQDSTINETSSLMFSGFDYRGR